MHLSTVIDEFVSTYSSPGTVREYRRTLGRVAEVIDPGNQRDAATITGKEFAAALHSLWGDAMPNTWNVRRSTVVKLLSWAEEAEYFNTALPRTCKGRKVQHDDTLHIEREEIPVLWSDEIPMRERCLYRCLYESASRISAILNSDVPDFNPKRRRIRVTQKGGKIVWLLLEAKGADMLSEYLDGRKSGPIWITHRLPWNWRTRPRRDFAPDGRRTRLSYDQAHKTLKETSAKYGLEGTGDIDHYFVTSHTVGRRSRLGHLAEDGWNTPQMQAVSHHASPRVLHERYAKVSPAAAERLFREMNTP